MNDNRLLTGTRVGDYTVRRLIGRGRNTEVYRAVHPDRPGEVAFKVLNPTLPRTPALASCFRHEAQAVAALKHPNIVRIYEVGVEKNIFFIAMELVEGATLRDLLSTRRTGLNLDDALRLFNQIASAVAYAHEQRLVHGSLRPDHVLLDSSQRPVLTDFDLPCLRDSAAPDAAERAPAYLAPEQISQKVLVPQSDIYALGILLYEMITGDVPFKGETREAVLAEHLEAEPVPPSQIAVGLAPRIEQTILHALRKRPEDRYASAREMLADLQRDEGSDQYETLTLEQETTPAMRLRPSEIVRFQLSRLDEPLDVPAPQETPPETRLVVWIASGVLLLALIIALIAVLITQ